ncbi:MAG: copper amine oxidase N-terminal domain-containing protein [Clostridia bacterium]|nr:copper amine oxidase N-terminal domain-containing protein [Clostridia bacterium]
MKREIMLTFILFFISCIFSAEVVFADVPRISNEDVEVITKEEAERYPGTQVWTGKEVLHKEYNEETDEFELWYVDVDGFSLEKIEQYSQWKKMDLIWLKEKSVYLSISTYLPGQDYLFDSSNYTSPFYILDENFNILKTIEHPGAIIRYGFRDGMFHYVTMERISPQYPSNTIDSSDFKYTYFRTRDFENIESSDSYDTFGFDGIKYEFKDRFSKYQKIYESEQIQGLTDWCGTYYILQQSMYHCVSLDGVYFTRVPEMLERSILSEIRVDSNIWYANGYVMVETGDTLYKYKFDPAPAIYVVLNGRILCFDQSPVVENDRTLVPMRFLFEQMGDTVTWDEETMTATASNGENTIVFGIDNVNATVNGEAEIMDVPARLINDKTYVPLRFLSENLGYTVLWDDETNTATILTDPTKYTEPTDIRCSINGIMVDSFAIAGNQYIPLYMLPNYGFAVTQNGDDRFLERSSKTDFTGVSARNDINQDYFPVSENKNPVYINGKLANTYKVNGGIVIQADELLAFGTAAFNPETRVFEIQIQ